MDQETKILTPKAHLTDEKPDRDWSELEVYKIEFEYLKHLTTINTGSILLVVAFLDKLFSAKEWKTSIAISLCCFVLSIIISACSQLTIVDKISEKKSVVLRDKVQEWTVGLTLFSFILYALGVVLLVAYAIKNLF